MLAARLGALLARAVALAGDARAREAAMLAAMDARLGDRFRAEMQASPPPPLPTVAPTHVPTVHSRFRAEMQARPRPSPACPSHPPPPPRRSLTLQTLRFINALTFVPEHSFKTTFNRYLPRAPQAIKGLVDVVKRAAEAQQRLPHQAPRPAAPPRAARPPPVLTGHVSSFPPY